jgi:hypothetical protein
MALFDGIQKLVISSAQTLYGDTLSWIPSNALSDPAITAKVLYNSPDAKATLGEDKYEYSPYNYWFDYYAGQLPGLKELVDMGEVETVTVNGKTLCVREVLLKFDGKTYIAFCDEFVDYKPEPK